MPKPQLEADQNDPRCIDYAGGKRWNQFFTLHRSRTGETMKDIAAGVGIRVENLYAYQRGHQVPTPATRNKLVRYLSGSSDSNATPVTGTTTQTVEDGYLVITTRIPLSEVTA